MRRDKWIVDSHAERPAGPSGQCFYCGEKVGMEHKADCVIRGRTVVVRVSFDLIKQVPEDWDQHMIEFHMNESSSCADNLITEISDQAERTGCACGHAEGVYLREATAEDEEEFKRKIADAES